MKFKYITAGILLFASSLCGYAQTNVLYHMKGLPQTRELNPALFNQNESFYMGFLPGLSSIELNMGTSGWSYNDLIRKGTGEDAGKLVWDFDSFYEALGDEGHLRESMSYNFLEFGWRKGRNFYGFSASVREFTNLSLSNSLIAPFTEIAENPYFGDGYTTGEMSASANAYAQFALNYGREITEKLNIGVAAKILVGTAAVKAENLQVYMNDIDDGYATEILAEGTASFALPADVTYDEEGYLDEIDFSDDAMSDFFSSPNMGFAVDLGASYELTDKITLSASIIDLGSIKYKNYSQVLTQDENGYIFNGVNISKDADDSDEIADEIEESFKFKGQYGSFSMSLPTQFYLGGDYQLNEKYSFGALARLRSVNGTAGASFTASANAYWGRFFALTAAYSMTEQKYDNLGLAMAIRGGAFQLYVATDDVVSLAAPSRGNQASFRLGMNWLFGRKFQEKRLAAIAD